MHEQQRAFGPGSRPVPSMGACGAVMTVDHWHRQLVLGAWVVAGISAIACLYAIVGQRPDAALLLAAGAGGTGLCVLAVTHLPLDDLLASRFCPTLFLTCSAIVIAGIAGLILIDADGGGAPLALLFIAPIVYAAGVYPPRLALAACGLTLATLLGLGLVMQGFPPATKLVFVLVMVLLSATGIAQSRRRWEAVALSQQLLARIERTAEIDELTGCLNGNATRTRVGDLAQTSGIAVAMVDLDDFKAINDTLGHDAGDRVLTEVGRSLRTVLRAHDDIGRLGGDEFVLLLREVDDGDLAGIERRVRTALRAAGTTASVGLALGRDDLDGRSLLRRADAAMYREKRHHRRLVRTIEVPEVL